MRKRLLGLLAIGAIVASACTSSSATPSPTPTPGPTATPVATPTPTPAPIDLTTTTYKAEPVGKTGGKLVLGEWQEPDTAFIGEYDNSATDYEAFGMSLWNLWSATADYKWYGQLASNIPTVANGGVVTNASGGMDVTINLVPGALWSDGQPITCDDLAYQWKWQMDPAQNGNIQGTLGWEDISGVDGGLTSTCVVHFKTAFEAYLTLWAPLYPKHYLQTVSVADAFNKLYTSDKLTSGVYSGPYIPSKWAAGAEIDFVPNAQFWATIKKSKAPFDSVVFSYFGDSTAEMAAFKTGAVDVAMNYNQNDLPALTTSGIPTASVDAIAGTTYEQNSWNYADLTKKFGADGAKALMTALHYAYDKASIITRIVAGNAVATCNFSTSLQWWYKDETCPTYDVTKANSILDAAGFTMGSDGVRVAPNGTKVEVLGCTSKARTYRVNTLTLLVAQLAQIGVKLDVKPVPTIPDLFGGWSLQGADVPCNTTHGNFDVAEFAWVSGVDPDGIVLLYESKYDPSQGDHSGSNYIRVNNPTLDTTLVAMNNTVDLIKVRQDMETVQDLYANADNAFPEIPLYFWKTVELKATSLHNVVNNATSATNTWNIEDWWRG
jgi:peptide/nickel transport system substrate-binding protein